MASYSRGKPVPAPRPGPNSRSPQNLQGAHGQGGPGPDRPMPSQIMEAAIAGMSAHHNHPNEAKAKTVLKEAVDAVVNSFAKHSHGYGRGIVLLNKITFNFNLSSYLTKYRDR